MECLPTQLNNTLGMGYSHIYRQNWSILAQQSIANIDSRHVPMHKTH